MITLKRQTPAQKAQVDVERDTSDVKDYIVTGKTPVSDAAMRQYLLDSIAWLDEGAE